MEIHGELSNSVNKHVVKRVEVETSQIIKKTTLETINLEEVNHETQYIKISQIQCTDKLVDVTVVLLRFKTIHKKSWRKTFNKWI